MQFYIHYIHTTYLNTNEFEHCVALEIRKTAGRESRSDKIAKFLRFAIYVSVAMICKT